MGNIRLTVAVSIAAAALVAGCADQYPAQSSPSQSYPSSSSNNSYRYGVVDRIEVVRKDNNNIAGTVIGGIVGGLIGHQIGGGSGQTAATIIGGVGGAVAGNQVENRRRAANESFRVTVRYDDGSYATITQDDITDLRAGDRVRVDNGHLTRYS